MITVGTIKTMRTMTLRKQQLNDPRFVACETLITFLAIENNNLIIHSDP